MVKPKIYEHLDYKGYVIQRIELLPKKGRGQLQRLAEALSVHPTLVSQVLRGAKNFTSEQAILVAEFFNLSEGEADYFLALVERERAGNESLKRFWQKRIDAVRAEQETMGAAFTKNEKSLSLTDAERYQFYSSWEYSAVRLATSIGQLRTIEAIAERLGLPTARVAEVLEFLLARQLCVEEGGEIKMGPSFTFLVGRTPQYVQHAGNWRRKAAEAHARIRDHELTFTMPVSIAKADRVEVRKLLLKCTEEFKKLLQASPAEEELCCLVVDWFDIRPQA